MEVQRIFLLYKKGGHKARPYYKLIRKFTRNVGTIRVIILKAKIAMLPPFIILFFPFINPIKDSF
jgi:hypothetical protein